MGNRITSTVSLSRQKSRVHRAMRPLVSPLRPRRERHAAAAPPSSDMKSSLFINRLVRPQSLWQAAKHEHDACPVGNAQANAPEVFSVEP